MSKLKVFFNEKQNTTAATSFSPSAKKPAILVKQWLESKQPIEVISDFVPVTKEQFYKAHKSGHVDAVLACEEPNGFYNNSPEIAATLPWTTGSLLAASLYAWKNKTITMSPTSGFHHATYNECMGFCTFNGLMISAIELLEQGAKKIGILDLDHHHGNGTEDIMERMVAGGKLAQDAIHHYTVGGDVRVVQRTDMQFGGRDIYVWQGGDAAERWLKLLPEIVAQFAGCDIVIFQAGADPHVNDPCHAMLGAVGALNNEQFIERDRMVFEGLAGLGIPVVWNLAGGYQIPLQKVLDIHTGTLSECLKVMA
jgi:acetoin utilization deacetylase AcuC-like enzyme